jgi:alginate O-acetyltransferase complex protein AlgI
MERCYCGVRFGIGLAKKVLLSDTFGIFTSFVFGQNIDEISFQLTWLGVIAFTLQVYFDFAGYSDMAIGLGALIGS